MYHIPLPAVVYVFVVVWLEHCVAWIDMIGEW